MTMLDVVVLRHNIRRLMRRLDARIAYRTAMIALDMLDLLVKQHRAGRLMRRPDAKQLNGL